MFAQVGQLIGEELIKRILNLQLNRYPQALDLKELRFQHSVRKEFDRLCALDLFIHTGNVDYARADLYTCTRDTG